MSECAPRFGDHVVLGEKLFEEKGKMVTPFIKEIDADGITMKQSFTSEVKGLGRWPSGMNLGSGKVVVHQSGKGYGKWHGVFTTNDGEVIAWTGSGKSKRAAKAIKGVMLVSFMTTSEKLKWMNDVIAVLDVSGDMMDFASVGYEWK
jgi:hypothetical protein